jgi:hypothetical protein
LIRTAWACLPPPVRLGLDKALRRHGHQLERAQAASMVHQIPFQFFLRDLGYETELVLPTYSGENGPQKAVDREVARAAVRSFSGEASAQEVVQLLPRGLLLLCHTPF